MNIAKIKMTIIVICLCMIVCLVPALANEEATESMVNPSETVNQEPSQAVSEMPTEFATDVEGNLVYELSVDDAIRMALENNPQIEAADAAITSATLSLEVITETQKEFDKMAKYINIPVKISEGLDVAYLKHGYYPLASQVGLDLATMEKEKVTAAVSYDVTEKYYNVKLVEKLVEISETTLSLTEENAEVVRKSFELGLVSELEVKNVENAVTKAENALSSNLRTLEIARESLRIALGVEGSGCTLILTDEITLPQIPENPEELIMNAVETRYDITALRKTYELGKEYFDITSFYVNDGTAMYHTAYSDFVKKEYTYENTKKMIVLSLRNDYSSILTAWDNVVAAENDLAIKQTEYDSAVIKCEIGMITNLELTAVMAELDGCRVQLENARTTYLLAVTKFGYNTTIGI